MSNVRYVAMQTPDLDWVSEAESPIGKTVMLSGGS